MAIESDPNGNPLTITGVATLPKAAQQLRSHPARPSNGAWRQLRLAER